MVTPHYMAPEQFERPTSVDHRADIYSLVGGSAYLLECDDRNSRHIPAGTNSVLSSAHSLTELPAPSPSSPMPLIVLIDDEPLVRSSYAQLLRLKSWRTLCFDSGESLLRDHSALEQAACFLIDYRLKGMSGIALLTELRKLDVTTPAILISGNIDDIAPGEISAIGPVNRLAKPCRATDLFKTVEAALRSPPMTECNEISTNPIQG